MRISIIRPASFFLRRLISKNQITRALSFLDGVEGTMEQLSFECVVVAMMRVEDRKDADV